MRLPSTNDLLIIDDEPEVIEVLEMYAENIGIFRKVIIARDGSEASKKMSNQKFACILLDINMPKKTGLDILRELDTEQGNDIQSVIIVSGELNKTVISEAMKRGCKNFLVKPFDEKQFIQKVCDVVSKTRPELLKKD